MASDGGGRDSTKEEAFTMQPSKEEHAAALEIQRRFRGRSVRRDKTAVAGRLRGAGFMSGLESSPQSALPSSPQAGGSDLQGAFPQQSEKRAQARTSQDSGASRPASVRFEERGSIGSRKSQQSQHSAGGAKAEEAPRVQILEASNEEPKRSSVPKRMSTEAGAVPNLSVPTAGATVTGATGASPNSNVATAQMTQIDSAQQFHGHVASWEDFYDPHRREWVMQQEEEQYKDSQPNFSVSIAGSTGSNNWNDSFHGEASMQPQYDPSYDCEDVVLLMVALVSYAIPTALCLLYSTSWIVLPFTIILNLETIWKVFVYIMVPVQLVVVCRSTDSSWSDFFYAVIWMYCSALPWMVQFPSLPQVGIVLLFYPCMNAIFKRKGDKLKAFRASKHASIMAVLVLAIFWFARYFFYLPPDEDSYRITERNEQCAFNEMYVYEKENCETFSMQQNYNTTFEESPDDRCCVLVPGKVSEPDQLVMRPGKCQENLGVRYVCLKVYVREIAQPEYATMRTALTRDITVNTEWDGRGEDVKCPWGFTNIVVREQDPTEVLVCDRLYTWATLQISSCWITLMFFGEVILLSSLRGGFLEQQAREQKDHHKAAVINTTRSIVVWILTLILMLYLGLLIYDGFKQEPVFGQAFIWLIAMGIIGTGVWMVKEFRAGVIASAAYGVVSDVTLAVGDLIPQVLKIEWVQAGLVAVLWPFWLLALGFSGLRHKMRQRGWLKHDDVRVTMFIKKQTDTWLWTGILHKVFLIGFGFVLFNVLGAQAFKVSVAWLKQELKLYSVEAVIGSYIVFAMFMFLNPVIPGILVYVGCGMILAPRLEVAFGWTTGVLIAIATGLFCKLGGSAMQMLIGRFMGSSMKIRYMCGLHTTPMRALEYVLNRPGYDMGRIAVINGMPDWPTSVFCGMIGLSISATLFWTIPTVLVVAPTVVSGATIEFFGVGGNPWGTVSSMTLLMASIMQGGFGYFGLQACAEAAEEHKEDMEKTNTTVATLQNMEEMEKKKQIQLETKTRWEDVPSSAKFWLFISAMMMDYLSLILAVGPLVGMPLFQEFELNGDFDAPLDQGGLDGNFFNLFTDAGAFNLTLVPIACIVNGIAWVILANFVRRKGYIKPHRQQLGTLEDIDSSEKGMALAEQGHVY